MKKIQFISNNINVYKDNNFEYNRMKDCMAVDDYYLNIIDLSYLELYENIEDEYYDSPLLDEIEILRNIINNSKNTKMFFILPNRDLMINRTYLSSNTDLINNLIDKLLDIRPLDLCYEKTVTTIDNKIIKSFFNFGKSGHKSYFQQVKTHPVYNSCKISSVSNISSDNSEKAIVVNCNNFYFNCLDLGNKLDNLIRILKKINLLEEDEEIPQWFKNLKYLNDNKLLLERDELELKIKKLTLRVTDINNHINENNIYKSVIYKNGKSLVTTIFKFIKYLLGIDLENFVDENKEDFNFENKGITFIGEIKGISNNIRNENISQMKIHMDRYKNNSNIKVKGILLINRQRKIAPVERTKVEDSQKEFACRENILIITSDDLLELKKQYDNNNIKRDDIFEIIHEQTGLFKMK